MAQRQNEDESRRQRRTMNLLPGLAAGGSPRTLDLFPQQPGFADLPVINEEPVDDLEAEVVEEGDSNSLEREELDAVKEYNPMTREDLDDDLERLVNALSADDLERLVNAMRAEDASEVSVNAPQTKEAVEEGDSNSLEREEFDAVKEYNPMTRDAVEALADGLEYLVTAVKAKDASEDSVNAPQTKDVDTGRLIINYGGTNLLVLDNFPANMVEEIIDAAIRRYIIMLVG